MKRSFADDEKLSFIKTEAGWRVTLNAENVTAKGIPRQGEEQE